MSADSTHSLETATIHDLENGSNKENAISLKEQENPKQIEEIVDDFPDGGLRAWLMVLGVSPLFFFEYLIMIANYRLS